MHALIFTTPLKTAILDTPLSLMFFFLSYSKYSLECMLGLCHLGGMVLFGNMCGNWKGMRLTHYNNGGPRIFVWALQVMNKWRSYIIKLKFFYILYKGSLKSHRCDRTRLLTPRSALAPRGILKFYPSFSLWNIFSFQNQRYKWTLMNTRKNTNQSLGSSDVVVRDVHLVGTMHGKYPCNSNWIEFDWGCKVWMVVW